MIKNKIPQQLQKEDFGFVKLKSKSKIPFEQGWQNKPYSYKDIGEWVERGLIMVSKEDMAILSLLMEMLM